jgi:hypothetical protein
MTRREASAILLTSPPILLVAPLQVTHHPHQRPNLTFKSMEFLIFVVHFLQLPRDNLGIGSMLQRVTQSLPAHIQAVESLFNLKVDCVVLEMWEMTDQDKEGISLCEVCQFS